MFLCALENKKALIREEAWEALLSGMISYIIVHENMYSWVNPETSMLEELQQDNYMAEHYQVLVFFEGDEESKLFYDLYGFAVII